MVAKMGGFLVYKLISVDLLSFLFNDRGGEGGSVCVFP